jgi:DNA-binding GntR family transcriptional regulator
MLAKRSEKRTRVDDLHETLRADILAGHLTPGQRLKFPELCARHEVSVSVVREALTRLVEQGLVRSEAHQGFAVVQLSLEDLLELTAARIELEVIVMRRALIDGDVSWESTLLAAHHTLHRTPLLTEDGSRISDQWAVAHAEFHEALLDGCKNIRLRSIASSLRDSAEPYRRWSVSIGDGPERAVPSEHQGILEAALARDADLAGERLTAHILGTTNLLVEGVRHHAASTERDEVERDEVERDEVERDDNLQPALET